MYSIFQKAGRKDLECFYHKTLRDSIPLCIRFMKLCTMFLKIHFASGVKGLTETWKEFSADKVSTVQDLMSTPGIYVAVEIENQLHTVAL